MAEVVSGAEHEIRALFEESKDLKEFGEKVLSLVWSRHEKLRRAWPSRQQYMKHCLLRFLEIVERVAEREEPPEDRDAEYILLGK